MQEMMQLYSLPSFTNMRTYSQNDISGQYRRQLIDRITI